MLASTNPVVITPSVSVGINTTPTVSHQLTSDLLLLVFLERPSESTNDKSWRSEGKIKEPPCIIILFSCQDLKIRITDAFFSYITYIDKIEPRKNED